MGTEYYTSNIMIFLAVAAALVVVIVLIILFLYNHKSNVQAKAINEIDRHITSGDLVARVKFEGDPAKMFGEAGSDAESPESAAPEQPETAGEAPAGREETGVFDAAGIAAAMRMEEEEKRERWERRRYYNVGKSGKVYSREEIEALIKD
ncbi:MAG: hypothetical protein ACOYJH_00335 [Anaerovoracaceae bacterium]|jgi:hypothetical protein